MTICNTCGVTIDEKLNGYELCLSCYEEADADWKDKYGEPFKGEEK